MPKENETFATTGTETYDMGTGDDKTVVLNIEENKPTEGVLLDAKLGNIDDSTGNIFLDYYNAINRFFIKRAKVKIQPKAQFFHLLSVMINSGMPMVKALHSLAVQMEKNPRMRMIILEIADYIESGAKFSEALASFADVFNEQEIGMTQAGEASGQLSKVLERLAYDTEKAYNIRKKVKGAMTYPVVIFSLLIAVVVVMMVYVIPQLSDLFASSEKELPLITRIVVGLSDFLINQKILLVGGLFVLIVGFIMFKKTKFGQYVIDNIKLKIPIFGGLFKMTFLSRFARSLSNLLESRISIVRAMEITANSIGNEVYKRRLMLSVEDVKQGIPIAESLTESSLFPVMLVSMLEVGEQTAQIDTIAEKIADFYENEVDSAVNNISKIIEPVILIFIGVTVGGVVAAIILPIMSLADVAGSI